MPKNLRSENNENIKKIAPGISNFIKSTDIYKNASDAGKKALVKICTSDAIHEVFRTAKIEGFQPSKGSKEIFYNFFGMNENWKWGRNIAGMIMVHCPEYPTYFIPSFSQAKATGSAGHIKNGEMARGLITGGLEGIAVGGLVSGAKIKPREMVPYMILGAALQLLSSVLFPWLGEKSGRILYNKKMAKNGLNAAKSESQNPIKLSEQETKTQVGAKKNEVPKFAGKTPYSNIYSSGLKI